MKYSAIVMLFVGALSQAEAREAGELVQIIEAQGMTAVKECKYTKEDMEWEMDQFSRKFDK